jgi:hypothetical protein
MRARTDDWESLDDLFRFSEDMRLLRSTVQQRKAPIELKELPSLWRIGVSQAELLTRMTKLEPDFFKLVALGYGHERCRELLELIPDHTWACKIFTFVLRAMLEEDPSHPAVGLFVQAYQRRIDQVEQAEQMLEAWKNLLLILKAEQVGIEYKHLLARYYLLLQEQMPEMGARELEPFVLLLIDDEPPERIEELIRSAPLPEDRAYLLISVGMQLAEQPTSDAWPSLMQQALEIARSLQPPAARVAPLKRLAESGLKYQQTELLEICLSELRQVADLLSRAWLKREVLAMLAGWLIELKRYDQALELIQLLPDGYSPEWFIREIARAYAQDGLWPRAWQLYESLDTEDERHLLLGYFVQILSEQNQPDQALALLTEREPSWDLLRAMETSMERLAEVGNWQAVTRFGQILQSMAAALSETPYASYHSPLGFMVKLYLTYDRWQEARDLLVLYPQETDAQKAHLRNEIDAAQAASEGRKSDTVSVKGKARSTTKDTPKQLRKLLDQSVAELKPQTASARVRSQVTAVIIDVLLAHHEWDRAHTYAMAQEEKIREQCLMDLAEVGIELGKSEQAFAILHSLPDERRDRLAKNMLQRSAKASVWNNILALLTMIQASNEKLQALFEAIEIAIAQQSIEPAKELLAHAETIIEQLEKPKLRAYYSSKIPALIARLYDQAQALDKADTIRQPWLRAMAYTEIVNYLLSCQDWQAALDLALSIEKAPLRDQALLAICEALAAQGEWDQVLAIVAKIADHELACKAQIALLKSGTKSYDDIAFQSVFEGVVARVAQIAHEYKRMQLYAGLVEVLALQTQWAQADQFLSLITDPYLHNRAVGVLAEAYAEEGDWQEAKQRALSIGQRFLQSEALANLVGVLIRQARFGDAAQLATQIKDPLLASESLLVGLDQLLRAQQPNQLAFYVEVVLSQIHKIFGYDDDQKRSRCFRTLMAKLLEHQQRSLALSLFEAELYQTKSLDYSLLIFPAIAPLLKQERWLLEEFL